MLRDITSVLTDLLGLTGPSLADARAEYAATLPDGAEDEEPEITQMRKDWSRRPPP